MTDDARQSSLSENLKQGAQGSLVEEKAFEKSRLEHCIRLYNAENSRRDGFEKTAQYYSSASRIATRHTLQTCNANDWR